MYLAKNKKKIERTADYESPTGEMVHRTQVNKLRYKNTFKGSEHMVNFFRGKERYFELCFHENEYCSTAAR